VVFPVKDPGWVVTYGDPDDVVIKATGPIGAMLRIGRALLTELIT